MFLLLFLLCSSFLLLFFYNFYWKRRMLPPGPVPWPILGNIREMGDDDRYRIYREWAKKYGPVYTIWIGEQPIVIVTDYELIKASFIKEGDSFVDRDFLNNHFLAMFGSVDGVIRASGEQWKQLRKFLLRSMRDSGGDEVESIENQVVHAVFGVINELEQDVQNSGSSEAHCVDRKVDLMTGSVINQMLLGYGFHEADRYPEFVFLKKQMDILQEYFGSLTATLVETSLWLRKLPYFSEEFAKCHQSINAVFGYARREIATHWSAASHRGNGTQDNGRGGHRGDMLDRFIAKIGSTNSADPHNYFKLDYLPAFVFDVFLAGQETTSNTINFLILYMMLEQQWQQRLHAELDQAMAQRHQQQRGLNADAADYSGMNVGNNNDDDGHWQQFAEEQAFRQADRAELHCTNAIVHETQRLCNLLPMNLTRIAARDVKIGTQLVRKGTTLVPQISSVLYDDRIFPEPLKFDPTRFLDADGQFKKIEQFVPFGVGKRICPGEALARMELFLFCANFFYKFHVLPPDSRNPPKTQKRHTFAVKLPDYRCHVQIRHC